MLVECASVNIMCQSTQCVAAHVRLPPASDTLDSRMYSLQLICLFVLLFPLLFCGALCVVGALPPGARRQGSGRQERPRVAGGAALPRALQVLAAALQQHHHGCRQAGRNQPVGCELSDSAPHAIEHSKQMTAHGYRHAFPSFWPRASPLIFGDMRGSFLFACMQLQFFPLFS